MSLRSEIEEVINRNSRESASNTPDHLLAGFMLACLQAFELGVIQRDAWYDISPRPGWRQPPMEGPPPTAPVTAPERPAHPSDCDCIPAPGEGRRES